MLTCLSAHDVTCSLPRHAPLLARTSLRCSRACPLTTSPVPSRGTLRSSLVPRCDAHVPVRSRRHLFPPAARSAPRSFLAAMLTCLSAHDVTCSLPRHAPLLARSSLRCSRRSFLAAMLTSLVPRCDAHVARSSLRCSRRSFLAAMLTSLVPRCDA